MFLVWTIRAGGDLLVQVQCFGGEKGIAQHMMITQQNHYVSQTLEKFKNLARKQDQLISLVETEMVANDDVSHSRYIVSHLKEEVIELLKGLGQIVFFWVLIMNWAIPFSLPNFCTWTSKCPPAPMFQAANMWWIYYLSSGAACFNTIPTGVV